MQIEGKVISELLGKYPEFRKRWFKSVFPYCIKFSKAGDFISK